jgi:hypothetical protein
MKHNKNNRTPGKKEKRTFFSNSQKCLDVTGIEQDIFAET